jgi:Fe-Mn family superoxide dismutase
MYKKIPLEYKTLLPYIGDETLNIHYNNIYNNYLTTLNNLLEKNNYSYNYNLPYLVENIDIFPIIDRGEILYNLGGVLNHGLYFYNISNKNNNLPIGKLKEAIDKKYGNYDNFKKEFTKASKNLVGSGYTFLVLDSNKDLKIINTSNQDTPYSYGFIPIMVIDLWEHSYFLDYKNKKEDYINNFFQIVDYDKINKLYEKALLSSNSSS